MYSLDTVFRDIRSIINTVVIKYENRGKELDTLDIIKAYDIYKLALNEQDTFYLYSQYDERSIRYAGINDDELVADCILNRDNIPQNKRDLVLYYQRYLTVQEFEEKNNYYRMLNGLPDVEDTEFVYIDIGVADELGIDYTTPVHLLTSDEITRLEHVGELDRLQAKYNKPYLKHLGTYKIPVTISREAKNFSILQMTDDVTENFYTEFHRIYNQCREYYMSVIYIKEFARKYAKYDNFIAMMIMTMAIQRMFVNTFKYGIDRDFYDLGSIKLLFDSYNVPFIEDLPISYQRVLMKNLNNLLKYKSSDKVLYDICSILGFDNIHIYKYFLSKEHVKDENDLPIFYFKEIEDEETHEMKTVLDNEKMFTFKWKAVDVKERNVPMALLESTNVDDYNTIISDDPFWLDDSDLRTRLYESEFNYIESKYLKMNIMYNMTEVLFENIFLFRMLTDKKVQTQKITMMLPRYFDQRQIPVFNVVMLLSTLMCKRNNFRGEIITTPSKTLSVIGFNFKADFATLKKFIEKNKKWVNPDIVKYFSNLNMTTAKDINRIYTNVGLLHEYLTDGMRNATTKKEYDVHKKLYDTLMITQYSEEIFRKSDGKIAETYLDYLKDIDVSLYAFVVSVEGSNISEAIEHILLKVSDTLTELKTSYYLNSDNNIILNALIKLVEFFKSYTTDLTSFNILYSFNDTNFNMIKLISEFEYMEKVQHPVEFRNDVLDKIKLLLTQMDQSDKQIYRDWIKSRQTDLYYKFKYLMKDKMGMDKDYFYDDIIYQPFSDILHLLECNLQLQDSITMKESLKIIYETY